MIQKYNYLLYWVYCYQKYYLCKINTVNPLYLIIDKADEYIEECSGNKYLTLVSTDKNKDTLKKYAELWNRIKKI